MTPISYFLHERKRIIEYIQDFDTKMSSQNLKRSDTR